MVLCPPNAVLDCIQFTFGIASLNTNQTKRNKLTIIITHKILNLFQGKTTLKDLDFTLRTKKNTKTIIYFNGMNVSKDLSDENLKGKLKK